MAILATEFPHSGKYTAEQRARRQAAKKRWLQKNKDKVAEYNRSKQRKEYAKNWVKKNPDKIRAYVKKWRDANADSVRIANAEWRKKNPDKVKRMDLRKHAVRRSLLERAIHPNHDNGREMALVLERQKLARETGARWCIDHIIPLAHGGVHHHDNLQLLPLSLNSRKSDNPLWRKDGYKTWAEVDPCLWPDALKGQYLKILKEESNCLS